MKKIFILGFAGAAFITPLVYNLPPAEQESEGYEEGTPDTATNTTTPEVSSSTSPTPQTDTQPIKKAEILQWPMVTRVSEDDKKLLHAHSKEIVQLFTDAQTLCKNMDDALQQMNEQRDAAQKQYRTLVNQLDPLFQNIGAAQAAKKNRKENS